MQNKILFLKTTKGIMLIVIISLIVGFAIGLEYKAYRIRTAFSEGFSEIFTTNDKTEKKLEVPKQSEKKSENKLIGKVKVEFIDKNFIERDYSSYITMDFRFTNLTEKDINGIQGSLILYDIFGDEIHGARISYDKGIQAGQNTIWTGSIEYNQFMEEHIELNNTELGNIRYEWDPTMIVYQDGTEETK